MAITLSTPHPSSPSLVVMCGPTPGYLYPTLYAFITNKCLHALSLVIVLYIRLIIAKEQLRKEQLEVEELKRQLQKASTEDHEEKDIHNMRLVVHERRCAAIYSVGITLGA